jgi:competence protein ComEA
MFSMVDEHLVRDAAPSSRALYCPWPVGVRGLLTVLAIIAALALRAANRGVGPGSRGAYRVAPVLVIDPNTAPPAVLGALPHVGPSLVRKLVEQREIRPFESIDDLRRRVRGLGPATLARLAPHLHITPGWEVIPGPQDPMIVSIPAQPELARGPASSRPR